VAGRLFSAPPASIENRRNYARFSVSYRALFTGRTGDRF
jgi:hypothetical protein